MRTSTWDVDPLLFAIDDGTGRYEVVLRAHPRLGSRRADGSRRQRQAQEAWIGDELAACRALEGLARELLSATVVDVRRDTTTGRIRITLASASAGRKVAKGLRLVTADPRNATLAPPRWSHAASR